MKIETEVLKPVVTDIICDICKKSCKKDPSIEFAELKAHWGFYSNNKDMEKHECDMCEECYEKVNKFIESLGGKIRIEEDVM
jgi:hypothetical protein